MIILSTGSLYTYDISRVFEIAAATGYDGVEIMVDARWDSRDPDRLARLSETHNVPIKAFHSPFVAEIHGWPRDQLERLKQTVALASTLGVPVVAVHLPLKLCGIEGRLHGLGNRGFLVPLPWRRKEPYHDFIRSGGIMELEDRTGVRVCLENMPLRRVLGLPINAYRFNRPLDLKKFPHLTLDTTHLGTWGMDPTEIYDQLWQTVDHVHLSGYDGREHRLPSDGDLGLATFLNRLGQRGYQGAVSLEAEPYALEAEDERKCRRALERCLHFCRSHLGRGAEAP